MRLGDMSYALYLWHWPVLVIYLIWRGREEVGPVGGSAIIALSLILAYLTTRLVERPLRSSAWANRNSWRSAVVIAVCIAVVAAPVAGWQQGLKLESNRLAADADRNNPGAVALLPGFVDRSVGNPPILPLTARVNNEWTEVPDGCTDRGSLEVVCEFERYSEDAPEVVMVGSSHAQVWTTAVHHLAEERGWNLSTRLKGWCPLTFEGGVSEECREFNKETMRQLLASKPDLVVTTSTRTVLDGEEYVDPSWVSAVSELMDAGITVAAIRDTPRMDEDVPTCVSVKETELDSCGIDANRTLGPVNPAEGLVNADRLIHLDFSDYLCPDGFCPPVVGNVLIYIDNNHLTKTYVASLQPIFEERLDEGLRRAGTVIDGLKAGASLSE